MTTPQKPKARFSLLSRSAPQTLVVAGVLLLNDDGVLMRLLLLLLLRQHVGLLLPHGLYHCLSRGHCRFPFAFARRCFEACVRFESCRLQFAFLRWGQTTDIRNLGLELLLTQHPQSELANRACRSFGGSGFAVETLVERRQDSIEEAHVGRTGSRRGRKRG